MEFALVLALFAMVSIAGWQIIAVAAGTKTNNTQGTFTSSALNPP